MAYLQPLLAGSSAAAVIAAGVVAFGKPPVPETGVEPAIAVTEDHGVEIREDAADIVGGTHGFKIEVNNVSHGSNRLA